MNNNSFKPQELDFYVDFINQFFKTGCIPQAYINLSADDPFLDIEDPILGYLRDHFSNMKQDQEAFSDILHETAYRNALIYFITELISVMRFYRNTDKVIKEQAQKIEYLYRKSLQNLQEALDNNEIDEGDVDKLGEGFSEYALKSTIELLNKRKQYPSLERILSLLGRTPSESGDSRISLMSGQQKLPHSGGSDIQGITVGQSFASLLPFEMALFSDSQTEDIFLHKYVDHQLQLFHHKSESGKISNSKNNVRLKNHGPIILTLDTSGSMEGQPMEIAILLVSNILIDALHQKRDCLLIVFSEEIEVIDLKKKWGNFRTRSLSGLGDLIQQITSFNGGTDITEMLIKVFELWESQNTYQLADLLVISDFEISNPSDDLLLKIMLYRELGYRFYGYQIGNEEAELSQYFNEIVRHEDSRLS
jgi:uncharacterized protein with von Willebrand factor type A (vWA) domain